MKTATTRAELIRAAKHFRSAIESGDWKQAKLLSSPALDSILDNKTVEHSINRMLYTRKLTERRK